MEKKYYFRGLGLGIIVTAVIMGIALSGSRKSELTDDEIIARAKELGMIEDSRLLDSPEEKENAADNKGNGNAETSVKMDEAVDKESVEEKQVALKQKEEKPVVGTPEPKSEKEPVDAKDKDEPAVSEPASSVQEKPRADTNEMTKQDEDVPVSETGGAKSITITSGDGSYTVAKKLAEAGVVNSADSYDDYLCANGYDKKLRPGTFEIPANASEEQIARIVTGQ